MQAIPAPFSGKLANIERTTEGILPDVFEIRVTDKEMAMYVMQGGKIEDVRTDADATVAALKRQGFEVHVSLDKVTRSTVLSCVRMLAQWLF